MTEAGFLEDGGTDVKGLLGVCDTVDGSSFVQGLGVSIVII